jgi:hypothetical protein
MVKETGNYMKGILELAAKWLKDAHNDYVRAQAIGEAEFKGNAELRAEHIEAAFRIYVDDALHKYRRAVRSGTAVSLNANKQIKGVSGEQYSSTEPFNAHDRSLRSGIPAGKATRANLIEEFIKPRYTRIKGCSGRHEVDGVRRYANIKRNA